MNMKKAILTTTIILFFVIGVLGAMYWYSQKTSAQFDALIERSIGQDRPITKDINASSTKTTNPPDADLSANAVSSSISKFDSVKIKGADIVKDNKDSYIVAFVGDQGTGSKPTSVLRLIKGEGAEALVILGDYDYADNPYYWYGLLTLELGKNFPLIPIIGNHDEKEWPQYSKLIAEHLKKTPSVNCQGTIAVKSVCQYRNLRVFIGAPGIESIKASNDSYADYFRTTAASLKIADTWNVCTWHKNQRTMQLGEKADEVGWSVYETCRELGFPIMNGHEHSYSRTFLMTNFKDKTMAPKMSATLPESTGFSGVKGIDQLKLSKGKSFVTVSGLGGREVRPQVMDGEFWSAKYTATQGGKPGALFCVFNYLGNSKDALCYFKNADGQVIDMFEMQR